MIEVDLRRAGSGCMDNPVAILSVYIERRLPLKILVTEEYRPLVKEILEIGGYTIEREEKAKGYYILLAR